MKTSMKIKLVSLTFLVFFMSFTMQNDPGMGDGNENEAAKQLRKIKHHTFQPGEVLEYRLHYGFVEAGTARLEVKKYDKKIFGREVYHVVGTGRSRGAFDWFFKVRDRYETYLDAQGVFPWYFVRRVNEGGYIINQDYKFYQHKQIVDNGEGKTFQVPVAVQDMLSAFYFARTIDFSNAQPGQIYTIEAFVDDELWPLKIKFMGRETVKVDGVKYRCLKFHPVVQQGRIFSSEEDLNVWVTDDDNKVPVLAEAKILVGSIKMEVTKMENLANPVAIVNKE
ncbi:MAG: hypothetical protein KatS3mg034_0327 [Vicingaceae bacterium]|nr:MAG: hypothetical protein KatS3mg034_0327 [Vicingaceae bacterium]